MNSKLYLMVFIAASSNVFGAVPTSLQGKVVYVDDGDTLTILDAYHQQHRIRLTDLDAPETPKQKYGKLGQPFSAVSGRNLAELAKGKQASAECFEFDGNERLVCRVFVDNADLSLTQIRSGLAWANRASKRYVRDDRAYQYEQEARRDRRGLWREQNPIEPWVWRRTCWGKGKCDGAGE